MSALLDTLGDIAGYVGDALGKPGRAVRGVLGDRPEEALAFVPFSDSTGLTDPSHALSGKDLLAHHGLSTGSDTADSILGFGAEVATDPLSYLGAGIVSRLGARAGRALETAAKARGPGYATTLEDALGMVARGAPAEEVRDTTDLVARLGKANPGVFSELPPGSSFLGGGAEGVAFRTPAGDVARLGIVDGGTPGRPVAESVLQATRGADYPALTRDYLESHAGDAVRAERAPFAEGVGDLDYWLKGSGEPGLTRLGAVKRSAAGEGLRFADSHAGNVGLVGGKPKIIDPGAVEAEAAIAGRGPKSPLAGLGLSPSGARQAASPSVAYQDVTKAAEPSALVRRLLDILGGQPAMQRALDAGLAAPRYERNLRVAGGVAGAGTGRL